MVAALGGPADFLDAFEAHLAGAAEIVDVAAGRAGFVTAIDTRGLGLAVVELGGGRRRASDAIDHAVGLENLIGLGASVEPDTPLARIHAADEAALRRAEARVRAAYTHRRCRPAGDPADPRADRLMPRAALLVMDSVGCGGAPDAAAFGDEGANTLGHIVAGLRRGPGRDGPVRAAPRAEPRRARARRRRSAPPRRSSSRASPSRPQGSGRAATEVSRGKDTPSGHWELAGVPVPWEWHYFPRTDPAIPPSVTEPLIARAGLPGTLCNAHSSGMPVIRDFGVEHIATGKPILYTSADSVLQIAAHETHFGLERLLDVCRIARRDRPSAAGRPGHRAALHRRDAGDLRAHRQPQGPRDPAAGADAPRPRRRRRRPYPRDRQDRRHLRPSRHLDARQGQGRHGARRRDARGARRGGGRRPRLRQLRRFRHALRPPARRRRLRPGARGVRRAAPRDRRPPAARRPRRHHRRPRQRPDLAPAPTTPASGCRCSRPGRASPRAMSASIGFADVGETVAAHLGLAPGRHGRSFL